MLGQLTLVHDAGCQICLSCSRERAGTGLPLTSCQSSTGPCTKDCTGLAAAQYLEGNCLDDFCAWHLPEQEAHCETGRATLNLSVLHAA